MASDAPLHIDSPLLYSIPISHTSGCDVYLKMDALQPSGSFKLRGVGFHVQKSVAKGSKRIISSSGGNAGLAAAYAGKQLGVPVTVVVPTTTPAFARSMLEQMGAEVIVHGSVWNEANEHAITLTAGGEATLIHPFDHPDLWEGHASMIKEVAARGVKPGCVVLSVGGGGLLVGVVHGLRAVGWNDVPVLAVETEGTKRLNLSLAAGRSVTLEKIDSVAKSLGSLRLCDAAWEAAQTHPVHSWVCTDQMAVNACARFLDEHRVLVEPACGATLSAVYDKAPFLFSEDLKGPILVIVCGGSVISLSSLLAMQTALNAPVVAA